jgi:hypothetical protein
MLIPKQIHRAQELLGQHEQLAHTLARAKQEDSRFRMQVTYFSPSSRSANQPHTRDVQIDQDLFVQTVTTKIEAIVAELAALGVSVEDQARA